MRALGQTGTSTDATHLANVVTQLPAMHRYDWVVDNLNTHWNVRRVVAQWCQVPFVAKDLSCGCAAPGIPAHPLQAACLPLYAQHGSWLNQVELWFRS